ncbi:MAG: T9SS type A sorting domain-containing protein [Bacteroidota bacterium]|nr:T9SS type A sorting domain-containing protein [Bacteroidota bacterium]
MPLVPVEATIKGDNGGELATVRYSNFWVGVPYINPALIQFECADGSGYLCTNAFGNEFYFDYSGPFNYFDIKLTNLSETYTYTQFTIYDTCGTLDCFPPEGTYLFHVRGNNDCGTATNWSKTSVEYVDCGMGGLFSLDIYPNPTTEQATITIVAKEDRNTVINNIDEEWQLEVYTQGQLLRLSIPAIFDNKYVLNTSTWKPGMYFIRVYYKDEALWGTLIVNE